MSSNLIVVIGHLREPGAVRDRERILRALAAIVEQGYLLTDGKELSSVSDPDEVALADSVAVDGITAALRDHLSAYVASDEGYFSATAHSLTLDGYAGRFYFGIALVPEDACLYVTVGDYEFRGFYEQRYGTACYEEFLRMLPVVYAQWHPLYMYDFDGGILPETDRANTLALTPRYLYPINLFGPELVEHMGAERVFSAPAWRVAPLDDGGALVVPNGGYAGVSGNHNAAVAAHLGLPDDPAYLAKWRANHKYP